MSWVGSPTAVRIRTMVTSPALGILAAPTLAIVAVMLQGRQGSTVAKWRVKSNNPVIVQSVMSYSLVSHLLSVLITVVLKRRSHLTVTIWPQSREIPFIWAMKMAATASYSAVPSMLMVAPTGRTKRVTLLSMPRFSSKHRNVTGKVPALRRKKNQVWMGNLDLCGDKCLNDAEQFSSEREWERLKKIIDNPNPLHATFVIFDKIQRNMNGNVIAINCVDRSLKLYVLWWLRNVSPGSLKSQQARTWTTMMGRRKYKTMMSHI